LLRDDGNEEKDVRNFLLSPMMEYIYAAHLVHNTGNVITIIVLTSK
jgi:hypothetical protein